MLRQTLALLVAFQLLAAGAARSADDPPTPPPANESTNSPTILPDITVVGHPESLTSPSPDQAAKQKTPIPGGFSVQGSDDMYQGRASNFEDLLHGTPGLFL